MKRPVLALSSPGIGKSSAVYQTASSLAEVYGCKFGVIEVRAATSNPAELSDIKAVINNKVVDLMQDWVPTEEKINAGVCPPRGFVYLDEIGDGTSITQSALQQLLLDRRLGSAKLAQGWHTVSTSNRQKDKSAAGRLSTALVNRCITVTVDPDTDCFIKFALEHSLAIDVIAFCRWQKSPWDFDPNRKTENPAFCSPRSMHILSDILKYEARPDFETIAGTIGDGVGSDFSGFLEIKDQLPDLHEIIRNPMGVPVPKSINVAIATAYALMPRVSEKTAKSIVTYIGRNEVEIANAVFKDLYITNPDLPMYPEVIEWMSRPENYKLFSFGFDQSEEE